ncbi:amidohydrolase family protein [Streptomyces sp. NPDC019531]|uniref:amidohydrolase family protein n=1 Tax=Streptomyces sp. NPDC019531 TaxID=3365062 RepID=UPI00384B6605
MYTIQAGSLFDGRAMSGPATVRVSDGRIVGVETGTPTVDNGDVIDLGPQACLLPGLIDCHVHLAFGAGPDAVTALREADDTELLERMRQAARSAVRAGITTVRDLGDRNYLALALAEELSRRPADGPEILAAGPPLTTVGGHCFFLGGETEGADALRAAVRERHVRGCAVVKIMASGGTMTPGTAPYESQFSLADLRVVVDEAHRLGLQVAAHAHGAAAVRDAVEAGVDTVEHMTFLTADGSDTDPALLTAVVERGTFVSLTAGTDPRAPRELPSAVAKEFGAILGAWLELYKHGARMVVGSDAGIGPHKPHDVLPYGVSDMIRIGVAPLDALACVTSVAAEACGVGGRKGRIAVGFDADLLAVGGDPSEDPARLRDVRAVFRAGIRVRQGLF